LQPLGRAAVALAMEEHSGSADRHNPGENHVPNDRDAEGRLSGVRSHELFRFSE
jgi:hypothetical protein